MEIEDLVDKYRSTKKTIRYVVLVVIGLLPAVNMWLTNGEIIDSRRSVTSAQLMEEKAKLDASKKKVADLPAMTAKLTEIEDDLTKARLILPDRVEIDKILSSLGKMEQEFGVKIANFVPKEEVQPNEAVEYKEIPIELTLNGPFSETMRFLDRLVHMPQLTHIRNIKFASIKPTTGDKKPEALGLETRANLILFKGI